MTSTLDWNMNQTLFVLFIIIIINITPNLIRNHLHLGRLLAPNKLQ